jgi:hypothetical protein
MRAAPGKSSRASAPRWRPDALPAAAASRRSLMTSPPAHSHVVAGRHAEPLPGSGTTFARERRRAEPASDSREGGRHGHERAPNRGLPRPEGSTASRRAHRLTMAHSPTTAKQIVPKTIDRVRITGEVDADFQLGRSWDVRNSVALAKFALNLKHSGVTEAGGVVGHTHRTLRRTGADGRRLRERP